MDNNEFETESDINDEIEKPRIGCFSTGAFLVSIVWFFFGLCVFIGFLCSKDPELQEMSLASKTGMFIVLFCIPALFLFVLAAAITHHRNRAYHLNQESNTSYSVTRKKTNATRKKKPQDTRSAADQLFDSLNKINNTKKTLEAINARLEQGRRDGDTLSALLEIRQAFKNRK